MKGDFSGKIQRLETGGWKKLMGSVRRYIADF